MSVVYTYILYLVIYTSRDVEFCIISGRRRYFVVGWVKLRLSENEVECKE